VLVSNKGQFNLKSDTTEKHSPSHAGTQTVAPVSLTKAKTVHQHFTAQGPHALHCEGNAPWGKHKMGSRPHAFHSL